ncbi:MAG TPA: hypothetical protein VI461_06165 [Chitinophagaceae bacterium]|nr:hypothetical protein [Chitinophagaceae bacterium]
MNFEEFRQTLSLSQPPAGISKHLLSLWHDAKGDWEKSHIIIQEINDTAAAWIHAYLHRKEGDIGNAEYWYHRSGKKKPSITLQEEWDVIVRELL